MKLHNVILALFALHWLAFWLPDVRHWVSSLSPDGQRLVYGWLGLLLILLAPAIFRGYGKVTR